MYSSTLDVHGGLSCRPGATAHLHRVLHPFFRPPGSLLAGQLAYRLKQRAVPRYRIRVLGAQPQNLSATQQQKDFKQEGKRSAAGWRSGKGKKEQKNISLQKQKAAGQKPMTERREGRFPILQLRKIASAAKLCKLCAELIFNISLAHGCPC